MMLYNPVTRNSIHRFRETESQPPRRISRLIEREKQLNEI